jgi:hypothetical protein
MDIYSAKKFIKIIAGGQTTHSGKSIFTKCEILSLSCEYTLSVMNFTTDPPDYFHINPTTERINNRNDSLYRPPTSQYDGIKTFNSLLPFCKVCTVF